MSVQMTGWTYGAEHEWVDWPRGRPLVWGCAVSPKEYTIVNSTGVAVDSRPDPARRVYHFGGEINTPPTDTIAGQVELLDTLRWYLPEATVNFRSELNIHIRVPGLRDDLAALKRIAAFNAQHLDALLPLVDPLPAPARSGTPEALWQAERANWRDRRRMQHTTLVPSRTERQLAALTVDEFFRAEVPVSANGRVMWHAQPRAAVNLRQMLETDTVEFRCFPGTLDRNALSVRFQWCEDYLRLALEGGESPITRYHTTWENILRRHPLPQLPFDYHVEQRYRATTHDGSIKRDLIPETIRRIEAGEFDNATHLPNKL